MVSVAVPVHDLPSIRPGAWVELTSAHPALAAAFSRADWDHLDALVGRLSWQRQSRGDIAEHAIDVAMLVTNCPGPAAVAGEAAAIVDFFTGPARLDLFQRLYGRPGPIRLRRAQINRMSGGDYNHFHRDTDDDPDYTLAVLVYPGDPADCDGGELCFEGAAAPLKPARRSLIAFPADLGHALRPVVRCCRPRLSIVLLFGEHAAPNRRFSS